MSPVGTRLAIWGQPASAGPPGCLAELEIGYVPSVAGNNKAACCLASLCWVNKWEVFQPAEERKSHQSLLPVPLLPDGVSGCGVQGGGELNLGELFD